MIKFTWKWNAPVPQTFTNSAVITRMALRILDNDLAPWAREHPKPSRWERVCIYFSNLWSAICGRRYDY